MAKELNEETTLKLSLKTLGGIAVLIFTLVGMWFTLHIFSNRRRLYSAV